MGDRFLNLFALLATPTGWYVLGELFSEISGVFRGILFLVVYIALWRSMRSDLLGPWTRLLARWLLRAQVVLFSLFAALLTGMLGAEMAWTAPVPLPAVVVLLLLLPLLQELLIRRLAVPVDKAECQAMPDSGKASLPARAYTCWQCICVEFRGLFAVVKQDRDLRLVRVVLALAVSYVCCCALAFLFVVVTEVLLESGTLGEGYGILGAFPLSFLLTFLLDRWFKRRILARRARREPVGGD